MTRICLILACLLASIQSMSAADGLAGGKHFIFRMDAGYVAEQYKGGTFKVIPLREGITSIEIRYLSDYPLTNRGPFKFEISWTNHYWESGLEGNLFFPQELNHVVELKASQPVQVFQNNGGFHYRNSHAGYAVPSAGGQGRLFHAWVVTSEDPQTHAPEDQASLRIIAFVTNTDITIRGWQDVRAFGALTNAEERTFSTGTNRFLEINYGCAAGFREIRASKPILVYVTPSSYNNYSMLLPTYVEGVEKYVGREFWGGGNPFRDKTLAPCLIVTSLEDGNSVFLEEMDESGAVVKKTAADRVLSKLDESTLYLTAGVPWYHVVATKDIYVFTSKGVVEQKAPGYLRDTLFLPDVNGVFCGTRFAVNLGMDSMSYANRLDAGLIIQSKDFAPFGMSLDKGYAIMGCPRNGIVSCVFSETPVLLQQASAYSMTYAMPVDGPPARDYLPDSQVKKDEPMPALNPVINLFTNEYRGLSATANLARFKNEYLEKHRPVKVVGFGDSVTHSARASGAKTFYVLFVEQLKEKFGYTNLVAVNCGIGGNNTFHGLSRIREDVVRENPQLIFVMFGVNDGYRGMNYNVFERNLRQIISILENETPALIVVLGPTLLNNNLEALAPYDKIARKVAGDMRMPYLSMGDLMQEHQKELDKLYTDFCHPGPEGHKVMAAAVWQYLIEGIGIAKR